MTVSKPIKTLLAVSPENSNLASRLFDPIFEIEVAASLAQVQSLLSSSYELIVAATCVDESRMFDVLRYCKAHSHSQPIPFVAIRIDGLHMDEMTHQAIQIATKALGAEEYIDLQRLSGALPQKTIAFQQLINMLIAKKRLEI